MERCLIYALETRRRVKEQLKKIGGMEFYDVHFSYIDQETLEEKFVSVPEQGGDTLIPDGQLQAGILYTVTTGATASHLGLYRLETQMTNGNGKLIISGMGSNTQPKEAVKVAFDYFKANASRLMSTINPENHEYHIHFVEFHNTGTPLEMSLTSFIALASIATGRPLEPQMVVLGSMTLGGNITPVSNLAETLQVAFDAGAKKILLPMSSVKDIPSVPGELFGKFQTSFYADPVDAANTAFSFLKANGKRISASISTTQRDYIVNYQDLQGIGMTSTLALPTLIALSSIALGKPTQSSLAVLGEISISGTMIKVDELANALQVCVDSGAKKVLLPMTSAVDLATVPSDLISCFSLIFYSSAEEAVFKALGVE